MKTPSWSALSLLIMTTLIWAAPPNALAGKWCTDVKVNYEQCVASCPIVDRGEYRVCKTACRNEKRNAEKVVCGDCQNCNSLGKCVATCTQPCSTCTVLPAPGGGLDWCTPPELQSWQACCVTDDNPAGYIASLTGDTQNCGACGNVCAADQNCFNGECYSCLSGQTNCGGSCKDLQSDSSNCGSCGNACPAGQSCTAGVCNSCNGADLQTDEANCGTCGNVCAYGQTCSNGSCSNLCPQREQGGAAYYVTYPCGNAACNCQLDVCLEGACLKWNGPNESPATVYGAWLPDSYPPEPNDGYCPADHAWPNRTMDSQGYSIFKCCDFFGTDCVCPVGTPSTMGADGWCHWH